MREKSLILGNNAIDARSGHGTVGLATEGGICHRVWARFRGWFEIPYGYEDDTGFHYGKPPRPQYPLALTDRACDAMLNQAAAVSVDAAMHSAQPVATKLGAQASPR